MMLKSRAVHAKRRRLTETMVSYVLVHYHCYDLMITVSRLPSDSLRLKLLPSGLLLAESHVTALRICSGSGVG
jgi:hypothetical protein